MRKLWELAILAAVVASLMGPGPLMAGDYKITHLDKNRVYPGKTLLADMSDARRASVVEVDFDGNVLWKWEPPGRGAVLDATYLKNGNILITVKPVGIFEVNRSGKTVWQHLDREASHDADRLANGNTLYNLGWQDKGQDVVREINPGGELVWSWTGIADYNRKPFADIDSAGWMHVNSVTRLDNGNTLVSIRNFNTVAEVGPDGRVVRDWTFHGKDKRTGVQTRGKIKGERNHEPEVLPNGNMLLCLRRPNRFVEFNMDTGEMVWSWAHPGGDRALRTNREANRLPNGNTLGSAGNKLIEIAPNGDIVWQMIAPRGDSRNHRKFHKAIRLGVDGVIHGG